MATHPITDLLAELEILAFQALDFGAQLHYFPARVLDWVNQLRGGVARTTDLYQMVDHDHLGLPRRPRFGKRRVPFYPLETDLYGRDRRSFTVECDEVYVVAGHKGKPEEVKKKGRLGRRRRLKGERGRGTLEKEKPPIFGMMQRGGEVVITMLPNVQQKTIAPLIEQTIAKGTVVYTDE